MISSERSFHLLLLLTKKPYDLVALRNTYCRAHEEPLSLDFGHADEVH